MSNLLLYLRKCKNSGIQMIFPFYFILFYLLCRVTCSVSLVLQCVPRKMFCLIADSVQISLKAHFNQTVGVNYDHNLGLALPLPFPFPCDKIIIFHPLVGTIDFPFPFNLWAFDNCRATDSAFSFTACLFPFSRFNHNVCRHSKISVHH